MIKNPTDYIHIQRQFKGFNTLLMNVVDSLSRSGNPIVSTALQDITQSRSRCFMLEQSVSDQLN